MAHDVNTNANNYVDWYISMKHIHSKLGNILHRHDILLIMKIPSEMEVAPLHNGFFELSNYWVSQ